MSDNRDEHRAETARRTDDSGIIDSSQGAPVSGTSGGSLKHDMASQADAAQVSDPEGHAGASKTDKLEYGEGGAAPESRGSSAGS